MDDAWAADGVRAGRMLLSARDGLITRLVVTFWSTAHPPPPVDRSGRPSRRAALAALTPTTCPRISGTLPNQEGLYKPGRLCDVSRWIRTTSTATWSSIPRGPGRLRVRPRVSPTSWPKMGDLFVVRAARRQGVGNAVVKELFARYRGRLGDRVPGPQPRGTGVLAPGGVGRGRHRLAGGASTRARQAAHPGLPLRPVHAPGPSQEAPTA